MNDYQQKAFEKRSKLFWNKRRLIFFISSVFVVIFGIVLSVMFSASNVVRGGKWVFPDPCLIDPGFCFAFEIKEHIPVKDENVEIKLYLGHSGYFDYLYWREYNTETQTWSSTTVDENEYDDLIFEIICESNLIDFQPIAIDFLSEDYKVVAKQNSRKITYKKFILTLFPMRGFDSDSGTINFYLRMRYVDDSKQSTITGVEIKYTKTSDKIKFFN